MLSEVEYSTFGVFCNKSNSETAIRSKKICGQIKKANPNQIKSGIDFIKSDYIDEFKDFFGSDVTVVPAPSSSKTKPDFENAPLTICNLLFENELAFEVCDIIERHTTLRKSSHCLPANRPSIQEHISTMIVKNDTISTNKITIIDDVLTKGSTTFACANLIKDRFPNAEVRIFAFMRTRGTCKYTEVKNPDFGVMKYNSTFGNVKLKD